MNDAAHFRLKDRAQAGFLLAQRLQEYRDRPDTIVLGLPRGGVAVAFELALALKLPLDVIAVRKLGAPGHEELAFGAIASGGVRILDSEVINGLIIAPETVEAIAFRQEAEMQRLELAFRSGRDPLLIRDRTVILIDDGIATGSTMLAAIEAVKRFGANNIVVAAAVGPPQTARNLASQADQVVFLYTPHNFRAVSLFFDNFPQLTDEDVRDLLDRAAQRELWPPAA